MDKAREAAAAGVLALARARTYEEVYEDDAVLFANAAIDAYLAARRAEGFVEVPVEPTEAMMKAGSIQLEPDTGEIDAARDVYEAMLSAAQPPQSPDRS